MSIVNKIYEEAQASWGWVKIDRATQEGVRLGIRDTIGWILDNETMTDDVRWAVQRSVNESIG